jgi:hypothetical protein
VLLEDLTVILGVGQAGEFDEEATRGRSEICVKNCQWHFGQFFFVESQMDAPKRSLPKA